MKLLFTNQQFCELAFEALNSKGFKINSTHQEPDGTIEFTGHRVARDGGFGSHEKHYNCHYDWPINCAVQCGANGIVFGSKEKPGYRTAFFEAFPRDPNTFIRGEGETIEAAEAACWKRYEKILNCKGHEFERRDRDDGYCFCAHCDLSGMFMDPLHPCAGCGATKYGIWSRDTKNRPFCKTCWSDVPKSEKPQSPLSSMLGEETDL